MDITRIGALLRARVRWVVPVVVVLVLVAAAAVVVVRRGERTPLERALSVTPAASLRIGFTDWSAVRARLRPRALGTKAGIERFISRGYDADLTAASSIDESAAALQKNYGFSPVNADWEVYAQSRQGAVMVLQMPADTDMTAIEDNLRGLGYQKPGSDTGVWRGGADLVAGIDPTITPELQYVVVDADRHQVLSSDTSSYAASSAKVLTGDATSLDGSSVADLAGKVQGTAAAFLWRAGFACEDLTMSQAADEDRQSADQLVRKAGGIDPLDGLLISMRPDRGADVALGFENERQAKADLRPRATLFVGPSPGRDGSYAQDLALTRSRTDGSAVVLDLRARRRTGPVLSAMSSGPVLFATC